MKRKKFSLIYSHRYECKAFDVMMVMIIGSGMRWNKEGCLTSGENL